MTLGTLTLYIGIAAIAMTLLVGFVWKQHKNWLLTFLQSFTGILFIFSGAVKAIDPLGTAYKMEQYFAEFEGTFSATWFDFLAPLFPMLSEVSAFFSVVMIVFEITLGLMLVLGAKPKFTSWAFLLLVLFFTALTGFTYLTGYVPPDAHFFEFGKWGEYVATNMKVTDCGCFGDFLKLEPKVSFFKDLVLLIPALIFIFKYKSFHQLYTRRFRSALTWMSVFVVSLFCFYNFIWNLPVVDFRPFYTGQDVRTQLEAERQAAGNVQVIAYKLKNKSSGKVVELPYEQFMNEFKNYPKEEWEYEQITSEPTIALTKISDFELSDLDGNDATGKILSEPDYSFMIVSHKMPATETQVAVMVKDTTFKMDTIQVEGTDSLRIVRQIDNITEEEVTKSKFEIENNFINKYVKYINPLAEKAAADGYQTYVAAKYGPAAKFDAFRKATGRDYMIYTADDILLKTIVRSNPGIVLWKDGKIIMKWHWRQLPDYETIKSEYMAQE